MRGLNKVFVCPDSLILHVSIDTVHGDERYTRSEFSIQLLNLFFLTFLVSCEILSNKLFSCGS